jgi:hypothetical protein
LLRGHYVKLSWITSYPHLKHTTQSVGWGQFTSPDMTCLAQFRVDKLIPCSPCKPQIIFCTICHDL